MILFSDTVRNVSLHHDLGTCSNKNFQRVSCEWQQGISGLFLNIKSCEKHHSSLSKMFCKKPEQNDSFSVNNF